MQNLFWPSGQESELCINKRADMNYHLLGKSSLTISEVGFGCMSLSDNDTDNARLIHSAIEGGLNYFDTADMYQKGLNEATVGKALQGKRDKVIWPPKWAINGGMMAAGGSGILISTILFRLWNKV